MTETLAATSSEEDVFRVILHPALEALGAEAGTVLLLETGQLRAVATAGQEDVVSLWQDGPLSMNTPTADVINRQSPLFFGHSDELLADYPALEKRTGGRATVANAVLPMVLEGRALGVVVLDFLQAHDFLEVERRFLRVLCGQCAVALGRIRQLQEQEQLVLERTVALSAFAALTEAVGSETDLRVLARQAVEVLQSYLPELRVVYGELEQGRWEARVVSDNVTLEAATAARSGYAFGTPTLLQAVQARNCTFIDGFDAVEAGFSHAAVHGAVAFYPYFQAGQPSSVLVVGTQQTRRWTDADRAMISAVGRSLGLAMERAETSRRLRERSSELAARTRALEGFSSITRTLTPGSDPYPLIRQAEELVLSMLPEGYAHYYELTGGRWVGRVQTGDMRSAALQALVKRGFEFERAQSLFIPWTTRQPLYQNEYVRRGEQDNDTHLVAHFQSVASLPVLMNAQPVGIMVFVLFTPRKWSRTDKAVMETTVRSLGLTLERTEYARQKEAQSLAVLEARSRAEQAVLEAERQRSQAETMTHLAHHDALTGLPNRAGLIARLTEAISACTPFALFYLDLDGFKAVNDTLGHHAGDALLIQITSVLRREVMLTDGHEQVLARIGGDEFTVMVGGVLDEDRSAALALGMCSALDQPFQVAGQTVFVTASTGIAVFPGDGQTPEDLLKNADLAMYQVKRESKNGWRHYRPGMNEEARTRLQLASGLRGALGRDEFQVHYQPQVDLESGEVRCLEALLRWFPAGGEVVSPAQFIPAAEASGLIISIGQWVLDTACAQLAVWRKDGFPGLRIAVNVSPVQFARPDFVEVVQVALDRAGLEAGALELELTERGVLADLPGVLEQFRALRRLGVQIALDDFGAGEAHLGRLLHLPFDVLKLDRNLIVTLDEQPEAQRFMSALQVFASSLDLELVAEGIETPAQLEAVRTLGCHRAQGYLLGRPVAVWPSPDEE
ncbi:bifunctional diguanylate cyclase/phosphodiesterase [Deinococcus marmoris]|uniref:bifunctional diguanylate cyclase/phosphodiesterase n=1 Tax=Deinococcus marmoris TaxID=249408 RepID=UPI00158A12FF|nr:EAL domain-containing protein [Deinococcus marmoris]